VDAKWSILTRPGVLNGSSLPPIIKEMTMALAVPTFRHKAKRGRGWR